jgi:hypothetical protein
MCSPGVPPFGVDGSGGASHEFGRRGKRESMLSLGRNDSILFSARSLKKFFIKNAKPRGAVPPYDLHIAPQVVGGSTARGENGRGGLGCSVDTRFRSSLACGRVPLENGRLSPSSDIHGRWRRGSIPTRSPSMSMRCCLQFWIFFLRISSDGI